MMKKHYITPIVRVVALPRMALLDYTSGEPTPPEVPYDPEIETGESF
ncbi:MAG: hypothetical protein J6W24_05900 [Prevotella sp.]|nr:hypothetical protein [Prevotella sp.]